ncbi:hypothetical protein EVAR_84154_1 [Eumeta japonica]|uniref:Uncharacterized protein n=1 Tax=Eumeta variegata TaxID=151549 RepID=A0A4C2A7S1_EUMVA|nr:hypothetical protein EVAR_84154_1 [Eumeta japonica]
MIDALIDSSRERTPDDASHSSPRRQDPGPRTHAVSGFSGYPRNGLRENSRIRHQEARRRFAPGGTKKCWGCRSYSRVIPSGTRRRRDPLPLPPIVSELGIREGREIRRWNGRRDAKRMSYFVPRYDVGIRDPAVPDLPVFPVFLGNGPQEKSQTASDDALKRSALDDSKKHGARRSKFRDQDAFHFQKHCFSL